MGEMQRLRHTVVVMQHMDLRTNISVTSSICKYAVVFRDNPLFLLDTGCMGCWEGLSPF